MQYLIILFALLYAAGLFLFRQLIEAPPRITGKKLKTAVEIKQDMTTRLFTLIVNPLVKPVLKLILFDAQKEKILKSNLIRAGLDMSPQEYYAMAIVVAALTLPLLCCKNAMML